MPGPELVLALAGVEALAYALLPRRLAHRVAGVVLLTAAWWWLLGDRPPALPDTAELWSVPPALLALAVGLLTWRRRPAASSWAVLGPGLVTGLGPSAVLGVDPEGGVLRPVLVVAACAALCLVGVARSWQAPLVVGAVGGALVAVGQLGPYAVEVPLWVTLGLAGALVLALAVRLERARRDAARAVTWLRALQ